MNMTNFKDLKAFEELIAARDIMSRSHEPFTLTKTFYAAYRDGQDGSQSFTVFNTRQEALDYLSRTEEELENGCPYDDGAIIEEQATFFLEGHDLSLKEPFSLYTDC